MASIFSQILNMSMTGSVVIVLVMIARLVLKRSPKIFSYVLWSVVLFRLLCPVAFTAPISILDVMEPEQRETSNNTSIVSYIPATVDTQADFIMVQPEEQQVQVESVTEPEEQLLMTPMHAVALVWATGMAGMMLYSVVQYLALRKKLVGSMQLQGNIYLADHIDTAFVVGLMKPRIYLPSNVPSKERYYILSHEQHHIHRFDHIIKLLAYLALCIHWFNPLVWVAFVLAGKDMEMSCDEAVIKKLGADIRADYSASLLRLATRKKILSGMPLAFGEGDTKGRVLNMAKWKKPAKWMVVICVILCLCILAVCVFNPEKRVDQSISDITRHTYNGLANISIGDLCFDYPAGLTSEQRDVDNWNEEDRLRSLRDLPHRRPFNYFFIDNETDFGGVVDFIVPDDREINLEEMNLPYEWVGLDYIAGSSSYPYAEMEYTLIKDGKDYIQMYLYTYSGRGYFLWFYTEQGNPAHKQAILESVELGSFHKRVTKLKYDEIVSLGQFNITIPKGYGYFRSENSTLEITKQDLFKKHMIPVSVKAVPNPNLPMESEEDLIRWVEAVGIDLSGEGILSEIEDESEYADVFLRIHNISGIPPMEEEHYLYIVGDIVYDLWIDPADVDVSTKTAILESIWIKRIFVDSKSKTTVEQPVSTVSGGNVITDLELVQYGSLNMVLFPGFTYREQEGDFILMKDSTDVGGIRHWNYPDFQPSDIVELKKEETGAPIGYMSGSSAYGDVEYEVFWDGNPDGFNEQHTFFIDGDIIYDVWYDENQIPDGIAERFLKTVAINADPVIEENPNEQAAFAKCRAVLEAVQTGSSYIVAEEFCNDDSKSHWSTSNYYQNKGNWLIIEDIAPESENIVDGEQYSVRLACMAANGIRYSNEGKWGKAYTDIEWREDDLTFDDSVKPWLAEFTWDENIVAYMDTLTDEDGECVMLRVDEQYIDSDEYDPHYFLLFNFDSAGNFVSVQLQVNLFRDNEINITESIASLDADAINAEIQKEYQNAIG